MNSNTTTINNKIPFYKKIILKNNWLIIICLVFTFEYLFTNDLHKTVNLYSLADLGEKFISIGIVSLGNNVPNPSFGWKFTNLLKLPKLIW